MSSKASSCDALHFFNSAAKPAVDWGTNESIIAISPAKWGAFISLISPFYIHCVISAIILIFDYTDLDNMKFTCSRLFSYLILYT